MSATPDVGPVQADERGAVLALLAQHHLPTDGLEAHWDTLYILREAGQVAGCAGLEVYEDGALLRSVAIDDRQRGRGLGQTVTRAAIAEAERRGLPALYLLTTTADGFFPRFGFERIARTDVPASVQQSIEFTSACPASAVVMRKTLAKV